MTIPTHVRALARRTLTAVAATGLAAAWPAFGVDGVKLIDQAAATNGNVTPGDSRGFPVTISQSGSYRLSSNLTVPDAYTNAIEIRANHVTLDLNGFTISGPVRHTKGQPGGDWFPMDATGKAVDLSGSRHVSIVNGDLRGMAYGIYGPRSGAGDSPYSHVERVRVSWMRHVGVVVGHSSQARDNFVSTTGSGGIEAAGQIVGNVLDDVRPAIRLTEGASRIASNTITFSSLGIDAGTYARAWITDNMFNSVTTPTRGAVYKLGPNACSTVLCP